MGCGGYKMADNKGFSGASSRLSEQRRKTMFQRLCAPGFGLLLFALPGPVQPARALDALSIAAINGAIGMSDQATPRKTSIHGGGQSDATFASLRDFVGRLDGVEPKPAAANGAAGDTEYSALRDFARTIDRDQPIRIAATAKPAAVSPKAKSAPSGGDATYVGAKTCLTCHSGQAASFGETLMGRIGKTSPGKFDCENCHGPGSAHAKAGGGRGVGGIISFRKDDTSRTNAENNAICLGCHEKGDRTYWSGSTHESRDVACTNCHTVMKKVSRKANLKTAFEPDTCFQCHKDRRAQMFRSSHMPIREGKMVCSDCHNPHGTASEALLRENTINDTCYKCHAEKRGPFLFEHAPVRENCANCHDAHGSVNEAMLKVSRQRLCAECHGFGHGLAGAPAAVQSIGRQCQNCHTQVHGTNDPSGPLLHR
jgi:DmsE family decaheme c-type cytochrome